MIQIIWRNLSIVAFFWLLVLLAEFMHDLIPYQWLRVVVFGACVFGLCMWFCQKSLAVSKDCGFLVYLSWCVSAWLIHVLSGAALPAILAIFAGSVLFLAIVHGIIYYAKRMGS